MQVGGLNLFKFLNSASTLSSSNPLDDLREFNIKINRPKIGHFGRRQGGRSRSRTGLISRYIIYIMIHNQQHYIIEVSPITPIAPMTIPTVETTNVERLNPLNFLAFFLKKKKKRSPFFFFFFVFVFTPPSGLFFLCPQ